MRLLVDRVNDPILRAAANAEQIRPIGGAGERKVRPGHRRFGEVFTQDAIETLELLDSEVLAVIAQVGSELLDLSQCDRIDTHADVIDGYRLPPR